MTIVLSDEDMRFLTEWIELVEKAIPSLTHPFEEKVKERLGKQLVLLRIFQQQTPKIIAEQRCWPQMRHYEDGE